MKNKATLLLHSFDELIGCLTDEEAGRLLKAILDYDIRGNTTDFDDRAMRFLFVQIRNSLDTHKAHYEKVCDVRRKSIQKRWDNIESDAPIQMYTNEYNINTNVNEKENIKENVCVKESKAESLAADTQIHKKAYGEFLNVFLTDEEYELVKTKLADGERRLQSLSAYIEATGKAYTNHYARLLNWCFYGNEPRSGTQGGKAGEGRRPPGERREPTFDVEQFKKKALNPVFVPPKE